MGETSQYIQRSKKSGYDVVNNMTLLQDWMRQVPEGGISIGDRIEVRFADGKFYKGTVAAYALQVVFDKTGPSDDKNDVEYYTWKDMRDELNEGNMKKMKPPDSTTSR